VEDQGDQRRAHSIEDRLHRGEAAIVDIERAEPSDDAEVQQDEGPAARPCPPEAPPDVRDPDPDLDGQRARQRLAHRDALSHLLLGQPLPLGDQLPLHLPHEGDRTAETDQPKAQVVPDEFSNRNALCCLLRAHHHLRGNLVRV